MLTETEPQAAAESLLDAERTRVPVVQLSKTYPQKQIEDAYRVQDLWVEGRTGIAWLVNKLAAVGAGLKEGHIVLGGSFFRPIDIADGDVIHADYGPLGAIGVSFLRD